MVVFLYFSSLRFVLLGSRSTKLLMSQFWKLSSILVVGRHAGGTCLEHPQLYTCGRDMIEAVYVF